MTGLPDVAAAGATGHGYLVRHWRGDLPLGQSYWLDGLVVSIAAGLLGRLIGSVDPQPHPQLVSWAVVVFLLGVAPVVWVWQMVGIWRSARRHVSRGGRAFWGVAARVMVVLGLVAFVLQTAVSTLPASREFLSIATGRDPIGGYTLRVLRDGRELEIAGPIGFGLTGDVRRELDGHPAIATVHLNSIGGRVAEARALAALIESRHLDTYTATLCASACILPYAAGRERLLGESATLGFHQYAFPGASNADFGAEYAKDEAFLRARGVREDFIRRAFQTSNQDLWTPSADELLAAHFVTARPASDRVALSGSGLATAQDIERALARLPLYAALRETDPDLYMGFVLEMQRALEQGRSIAEARAAFHPKLAALRDQRLPFAPDATIVAFSQLMLDEWRVLQLKDPALCFAYAVGGDGPLQEQAVAALPASLNEREVDLFAAVVRAKPTGLPLPGATADAGPAAQASLERAVERLRERYGDDVSILTRLNDADLDKTLACGLIVALYQDLVALPAEEAGPVLRLLARK